MTITVHARDQIEVEVRSPVGYSCDLSPAAHHILVGGVETESRYSQSCNHFSGCVRHLYVEANHTLAYSLDRTCVAPGELWLNDIVLCGKWDSLYLPDITCSVEAAQVQVRTTDSSDLAMIGGSVQAREDSLGVKLRDLATLLLVATKRSIPSYEPGIDCFNLDRLSRSEVRAVLGALVDVLGDPPGPPTVVALPIQHAIVRGHGRIWPAGDVIGDLKSVSRLAHEMAHFWWRLDNVPDAWLREGLAHYYQVLIIGRLFGSEIQSQVLKAYHRELARTLPQQSQLLEPISHMVNDGAFQSRVFRCFLPLALHMWASRTGQEAMCGVLKKLLEDDPVGYPQFRSGLEDLGLNQSEIAHVFEDRLDGDLTRWLPRMP